MDVIWKNMRSTYTKQGNKFHVNCRPLKGKAIKLLEDNIGKYFHDLRVRKVLNKTQNVLKVSPVIILI